MLVRFIFLSQYRYFSHIFTINATFFVIVLINATVKKFFILFCCISLYQNESQSKSAAVKWSFETAFQNGTSGFYVDFMWASLFFKD
jgi:hypothetical protein